MSAPQFFTSKKLYAWLSGAWVDLTADWQQTVATNSSWGINGYKSIDILADTGTFNFTLSNLTEKYYPDGPSPLTGWGRFVPVRVEFGYFYQTYRYLFYVDKIDLIVGRVPAENFVRVSCTDWFHFANQQPILAPSILENSTVDVGIGAVVDVMSKQPANRNFQTGITVFKTIFDNTAMRTTAYAEMAKLVNSEWAHCYLIKDILFGETLVLESQNHRNASHPVGQIGTITMVMTPFYHMLESGDYHLLESGDKVLLEPPYSWNSVTGAPIDILIDPENQNSFSFESLDLRYGEHIVNRMTVEAVPKRVDQEPVVLYSLGTSMPIGAGETLVPFRARYTDPSGGNRVNAITSSMLPPEVPGAVDPYLMTLLHFTDGSADSTGRHTWTLQNTPMIVNDVYADGYGTTRISGNVVGPYAIFGGYDPYFMSVPNHADFNFGSGAFTIGWKEARINPVAGAGTMTRNVSKKFAPFVLGVSDGTNLLIFMSSNGSTWNVANGRSLGKLNVSKWVDYEVSRDADGWFYAFADGQLTDKWYRDPALYSFTDNTGTFSVGKIKRIITGTETYAYTYMGFDEFFVKKGECLHRKDFTPRITERKTTLEGDYQLNTLEDWTGDDLSADMSLTAEYASEAVTYRNITNGSARAGFVTMLQARGRGVYSYNPIEDSAEDVDSQNLYGYQTLSIRQPYQQNVVSGMAKATATVAVEKDAHTDLVGISFVANRSLSNMSLFLQADVGTLLAVKIAQIGINGYYYIQDKSFTLEAGGILRYHFGVYRDYLHVAPPVPPAPVALPFDEHFIDAFSYIWTSSARMMAEANTGTVAHPGNSLLTFGADGSADFTYASGATGFTWEDVDTITIIINLGFSVYDFFLGLINPFGDSKIGFIRSVTSAGGIGAYTENIIATGCDASAGNQWAQTLSGVGGIASYGYVAFSIRRISATSAAWSWDGGAETVLAFSLPADGDTLIPSFIFMSGAAQSRTALIDRVLITKRI